MNQPLLNEPAEFVCIDCDAVVYAFGYVTQRLRCATCEWIASLPTSEEQAKARTFLSETEK